jgi:hypothetical protein
MFIRPPDRSMIDRLFGKSQKPDVKVDGVFDRPGYHRVTIEVSADEPVGGRAPSIRPWPRCA